MSRIMSKLSVISEARRKAEENKRHAKQKKVTADTGEQNAQSEEKRKSAREAAEIKRRIPPSGTRPERMASEQRFRSETPRLGSARMARGSAQQETFFASLVRTCSEYRRPLFSAVFIVFVIVLLGGVLKSPVYEASARIEFAKDNIQNEWDLLVDETRNIDFEEQVRSRSVLQPVLTELGWFPPKAGPNSEELKTLNDTQKQRILNQMLNEFQEVLVVERIRHSGVLRIGYSHTEPKIAAKAANLVAFSFIDFKRQQAMERAEQQIAAMDEELATIKAELGNVVEDRKQFLLNNGWDNYVVELNRAEDRVAKLKTDIRSLDDTIASLGVDQDTLDDETLNFIANSGGSAGSESSISELRGQLADVESRLSQIRGRYLPDNPLVVQAAREKEILEAALSVQAKERKVALEEQLLYEQLQLRRLMEASPQAKSFEASIANAESQYQELLERKAKARLALNIINQPTDNFGSLRILDRAVAPEPIPRLRQLITASIGALLVATFVFLVLLIVVRFFLSPRNSSGSFELSGGAGASASSMQRDPQNVSEFLGNYISSIREHQKKG